MQKINSAQSGAFFMGMRMRKTIAFLFALLWTLPAAAVGTIPGFSLQQQTDTTGRPLGGGLLYLIQAGTTSTPQNCYQDTGLTIAYPNPVVLDAYGRVPQLFCADGQIKVRLTDKNGVQQFVQDNILIIGASSGGGGGGAVDPTTVLQTGDFKMQYGTGPISGFVRCNGRTIGSATSGASERANADTSALFSFLWNADPNLAVTGGRGASASADFAANKPIALPDCRGRALAGLDDMGNVTAGRLTTANWGAGSASPTTLGAGGGLEKSALSSTTQLPQFTPTTASTSFSGNIAIPMQGFANNGVEVGTAFSKGSNNEGGTQLNVTPTGTVGVTMNSIGSASPTSFATASPSILTTVYLKL